MQYEGKKKTLKKAKKKGKTEEKRRNSILFPETTGLELFHGVHTRLRKQDEHTCFKDTCRTFKGFCLLVMEQKFDKVRKNIHRKWVLLHGIGHMVP